MLTYSDFFRWIVARLSKTSTQRRGSPTNLARPADSLPRCHPARTDKTTGNIGVDLVPKSVLQPSPSGIVLRRSYGESGNISGKGSWGFLRRVFPTVGFFSKSMGGTTDDDFVIDPLHAWVRLILSRAPTLVYAALPVNRRSCIYRPCVACRSMLV